MPLEILQLDVTDGKSIADAIDIIDNRQFETNFFWGSQSNESSITYDEKQKKRNNSKCKLYRGIIGVSLNSAYVGSKFALEGFSESMKYELEGFGIKVILI